MSKLTFMANRYGPLWKRMIPKYPVYAAGGPQNRVFLCQFWMKIVKPRKEVPPDTVHFIVHPQMSALDVRQYLEKIYKIPVISVKMRMEGGEPVYSGFSREYNERGAVITGRRDDTKYAVVILGGDCKFTFPNIFEEDGPPALKEKQRKMETDKNNYEAKIKNLPYRGIPPWFSLQKD